MLALDPQAVLDLATAHEPGLLRVLANILEHPHREIVVDTPLVELEGLTEPDTERFLELITDPGALSPAREEPTHFLYDSYPYQFTKVFDARPRVTFDSYPNKFVKHVVLRYRDALTSHPEAPEASLKLARQIDGLIQGSVLKEVSMLHHVSADHNVLRKDPNYREILRLSISLSHLVLQANADSVV